MEAVGAQAISVLVVLAIVVGPVVSGAWLLLRRKKLARQTRKSPLTIAVLRAPGHTLRQQLEESRVDMGFDVMTLMAVPALGLATLYMMTLVTGRLNPIGIQGLVLVAVAVYCGYQIRSLLRRGDQMDRWRLGLDAEMAAGQELDQLMRRGAVVFHDLAGDKFNIDHVVVAPQGVFAVETKGYRKPNRDGGAADATVIYDGEALKFPDWSGTWPLRQAMRQARWLSEWLTSATGEKIEVAPVLTLPGWYVDRKGRGPVLVLSGAELQEHLLRARDAHPLRPEQMQRVVHQVEQRCRDVKPFYRPIENDA